MNFNKILINTKQITITEILYNLNDFETTLIKSDKKICFDDDYDECLLTPFYVKNNRRLELYNHELNIKPNSNLSCVETNKEYNIDKNIILNFIELLKSSTEIQADITKAFGDFNSENLYFAVY